MLFHHSAATITFQGRESPIQAELQQEFQKTNPNHDSLMELLDRSRGSRLSSAIDAHEVYVKWPILMQMKYVSAK